MARRRIDKQFWVGILWLVLSIASYELLNHVGRATPIELTTDFDRALPLVPAFVIPYLSFIPLVFVILPWLTLRSTRVFRAYTLSLFIAQMIMNALYLLVPATVPRPSLAGGDPFTILLRDLVWKLDEPINTFPSNHVTFSVIAILALASLKLGKWWVLPLQMWLGLVCVSTLLVHQHVIADLVSGVVIGASVYALVTRVSRMRADNVRAND